MGDRGIAYNCNNFILAIEMKRIEKEKKALEKRNKSKTKHEKEINATKDVIKK